MTKLNTVEQIKVLRAAGFGVFISHQRPLRDKRNSALYTRYILTRLGGHPSDFAPTGGLTSVTITDLTGQAIVAEKARCSELDHFHKRRGLDIAFGRAFARLRQHPTFLEAQNG